MSKKKTELTRGHVHLFLQRQFAGKPENIQQLVEGEESQAFSYECDGKGYVLRIHRGSVGFQKDAYAANHFHSEKLPIPRVIQVGSIDEHHAFCLTEKRPGFTFQDADPQMIRQLLEPITQVWLALKECDLCETTGFGDFDADGQGVYATWQEFLLSLFDSSAYDWSRVVQFMGQTAFRYLVTPFISLAQSCPEERSLVHGDFGSNNVLTDGQNITAVLDWENAKYGDPLFDVATAYFWSPWLNCMAAQAGYYDELLSTLPSYHERLRCYQLRIGLDEIHDTVIHQNWRMAQWAIKRSTEIVHAL
ncbi:MAG TPA: aminoglycoside phosphotransferase family protein [Ktedonobacteraceae bacterium]|nr:aminoglycoside phosphotransferase family protein [Ktedonobacteraceae bacterium]